MYSYIWNSGDSELYDKLDSTKLKGDVSKIVPLIWREHCMECAMPLCYNTCPLYKKRIDGRCIRFEKGITPVSFANTSTRGANIEFRRWAKLQAYIPSCINAVDISEYERIANAHQKIEHATIRLCHKIKRYRIAQVIASLLERISIRKHYRNIVLPDGFLAVIKNEEAKSKEIMIEILQGDLSIYKNKFTLSSGWNENYIPLNEIHFPEGLSNERIIRAYLNPDETATLTFAYFDFVKFANTKTATPAPKIKCVAWDLDNTLWKGIIGDDGPQNVHINQEAYNLIQKLDERGILQTIASKNNHDIAWNKIIELGLDNMFLYPAINWEQKSKNIQKVADLLNIGVDTFALIDDSSFERAEVSSTLPQVRVYDAKDISVLLTRKEFDVPISEESKHRRQSYLNEIERKKISKKYAGTDGDYISFLKDCKLEMSIFAPESDLDRTRCLELLLRSNQYNVSGHRYDQNEFHQLLISPNYRCLAFRVKDRFGDYGIVGFASFSTNQNELTLKDFVMSCRVAMKHIECAFIYSVFHSSLSENCDILKVNIIKTERNNPLREQFLKMPFKIEHEDGANLIISLHKNKTFEDENIIKVKLCY